MRIIASLLIFLGITINAAPFSGAKLAAFTANVPASGGGGAGLSPTNITGNIGACVGWWQVTSSYSAPNLSDRSGLGNTLVVGGDTNPTLNSGGLNGKDFLQFVNAQSQFAAGGLSRGESIPMPVTVAMVMRVDSTIASTKYFDSTNSDNRFLGFQSAGKDAIYAQSTPFVVANNIVTAKWMVWSFEFLTGAGGTGTIRTNNVVEGSGSIGDNTTKMLGFTLASSYGGSADFASISVADVSVYTNLTTVGLSNVFYYYTNLYSLTP